MPIPNTHTILDVWLYLKEWASARPADVSTRTVVSATHNQIVLSSPVPAGDYRLHYLQVTDPGNSKNPIKKLALFVQSVDGSTVTLLHPLLKRIKIEPGYTVEIKAGPLGAAQYHYNSVDQIADGPDYVVQVTAGDEYYSRNSGRMDSALKQSRIRESAITLIIGISRKLPKQDTLNLWGGFEGVITQMTELLFYYAEQDSSGSSSTGSDVGVEYYLEDDMGQDDKPKSTGIIDYALLELDIYNT